MEEEYDTDAFMIFVIAMISIYIVFASWFLFRRIRRLFNKEPSTVSKKKELVETEEPVVENPLTAAFWINLVLVILGLIVVSRLVMKTQSEEPEVFDPYATLGISVGASEKAIRSAYRKMAKLYHPDKPTGSVEKFRDVEKAYRILTDEIARSNYEKYGNPDGPSSVTVGIALPSWMMEKTGSKVVMLGYLVLMIVVIPLVVYCLKTKSNQQEKPKISQDTLGAYFHMLNESSPVQSVPEVFVAADELLAIMQPQSYDGDIMVYLNNLCSKKDFGSTKMRKPHVSLEKVKEDPKAAAWLKGNVLLHCYLNNMEVSIPHQQDIKNLLNKAPELLNAMLQISLIPRIKGKQASLSLTTTVIHFQQYVYQGLWVNDSPLKQLPHITDREVNANKTRNRDNDLKEFLQKDPAKWKGVKQLSSSQMTDLTNAVRHFPRLAVEARFEVSDEEDIFVGDIVTCFVKVVHENLLPEGVSVKDVMEGKVPDVEEEEEEEEEEKEEKKEEKEMMTAEEFNAMLDETPLEPMIEFEDGIVYSKHYPFKIHEHWMVVLSDVNDKYAIDGNILAFNGLFEEQPIFQMPVRKEGIFTYHLHFFCPCYLGLDFTVAVSMKVKPESMKPKIVINEKDLALDKKKGLVDMLNVEMDDGWESEEEEEEKEEKEGGEKEGGEKEEGEKEEVQKQLSKKERQRLYHLKKKEEKKREKEVKEEVKEEEMKEEEEVKEEIDNTM